MSTNLQGLTLNQAVARLASRVALLNVFFDMGGAYASPAMTQPVLTAAARVRELALLAPSFTGTNAAPQSVSVTQVAALYSSGTSTLSMADLDTAAALPTPAQPGNTPVEVAGAALQPCTSMLLLALARGGAASQLPPLVDPYMAAIKTVEARWLVAVSSRHGLGAAPRRVQESEVATVDCDWCGAAARRLHNSGMCVTAGSEYPDPPAPMPAQPRDPGTQQSLLGGPSDRSTARMR